jgi:hypothetical protein
VDPLTYKAIPCELKVRGTGYTTMVL